MARYTIRTRLETCDSLCRVCITGVNFPSAAAIARAQAASGDVPLLHAIVDHGDIDFFGLGRQRTEDAFPPQ